VAQATQTISQTRGMVFYQRRQFGDAIRTAVVYALLVVLSATFLFPFFWMISSALKENYQTMLWPPVWIPDPPRWQNFADALFGNSQLPFPTFFVNTMTIEVFVMIGRLVSCVIVAYAFARLEAPGKDILFAVLLSTLMLPSMVTMIPKFILFNMIGWVNTFLPLTVPAYFGEAFAIFMMRQFFMGIPRELEEAMRIDGAGTVQVITRLIVPLSLPVITLIAVFTFKDTWNDFFGPLIYLNDASKYTLAVGLAFFNGQFRVDMNLLMAANVVVMLPLVILFFVAQRVFVEGISLSGLTGR
jgi:ABC-type glycerol-3-phosphate transport system permease component